MAIPHYERGVAQNMVILLEREPAAFDPEKFPEWVWVSSLFGRLTHNLVMRDELSTRVRDRRARAEGGRGHPEVAPAPGLPTIPGLELGAYYQTSQWAGGDYYDFFPLPGGSVGHPDRGRQRPRDAGGRDDGDHAQPGPRPARQSRARRPRCWRTSTGNCAGATTPATRGSSRRSTGSSTRPGGR